MKISKLLQLYAEGLSFSEIARKGKGYTVADIKEALVNLGVDLGRGTEVDWAARHEVFLPLYEKGYSDTEIGAQTGVSSRVVGKWRSKHNLKSPKQKASDLRKEREEKMKEGRNKNETV